MGRTTKKRRVAAKASVLNLANHGLCKDLGELVYSRLTWADRQVVRLAHARKNKKRREKLYNDNEFRRACAKSGYLPLLMDIFGKYTHVWWGVSNAAAENGHLHVLKWLRKTYRDHFYTVTCAVAAGNGHLHILKWLRKHGCPWDAEVHEGAAKNGHLHVIQWALANGCPWGGFTMGVNAGHGGHLHVLQWAMANGYTGYPLRTWGSAASAGHLHILQWAATSGQPDFDPAQCLWRARDEKVKAYLQSLL
jgi:hypothetical protein